MANANERVVNGVKTRVLHNKDYVEVAERVRIVHQVSKDVEMVESAPFQVADRWLWRVIVKVDGKTYIGNAEAKLNAAKNTPDGTNPFECAETSALGRALAFAGLGTVESISSYDEVARGKPFETRIQAVDTAVVESGNARQIESPVPTVKAIYNAGKEKKFWLSSAEFFDIAGGQLGFSIDANTALTPEQKIELMNFVNVVEPSQVEATA